ncbi:hypothetical protein ORI89_12665 [Sphingobacterium sp. UT-1RO-CII-1]|uniref:MauE/DoxX family redox-associated membrane protein n=1 Tax=Sphingobacterium sp. UT-1RO-CII-1 TaxID=2995225 RepID=UPI00227CF8AB|nr:MauE/DoxX family redox-associated membrane protein [Sphingobacterium sp. UT-1RO-CII-1]MCY4780507.1 hypothetical protein [Sphingobacterium sp. UT-1RO-CII-1]
MKVLAGDINKHFRQHLTIYLDALAVLCAALLIYLFVQTALSKVLHHAVFRIQMGKQPLPGWSKPLLVYALPVIEWATVLLLLLRRTRLWGLLLAGSLLFAYTVYAYLAYKEVYGYVICACGKVFEDMGWREHFYFNAIHTLVALAGFYFVYKSKTLKANNKKE